MIESTEGGPEKDQDSGLLESVRDESESGAGQGYVGQDSQHGGQDSQPDPDGTETNFPVESPDADPTVVPEPGGYAGRDPKSDMPTMPSAPETTDDPQSHDAAPGPDAPEPSGS